MGAVEDLAKEVKRQMCQQEVPVFPVRYSVKPKDEKDELKANEIQYPELQQSSYCLRIPRLGFIYVYDEADGNVTLWQSYKDGTFRKVMPVTGVKIGDLPSIVYEKKKAGKFKIEKTLPYILVPAHSSKVYVGFSYVLWTEKIIDKIKGDAKVRENLMTKIDVDFWDEEFDFDNTFPMSKLPEFVEEYKDVNWKEHTPNPFYKRPLAQKDAKNLENTMKANHPAADKKAIGVILHDVIGLVAEQKEIINGYRAELSHFLTEDENSHKKLISDCIENIYKLEIEKSKEMSFEKFFKSEQDNWRTIQDGGKITPFPYANKVTYNKNYKEVNSHSSQFKTKVFEAHAKDRIRSVNEHKEENYKKKSNNNTKPRQDFLKKYNEDYTEKSKQLIQSKNDRCEFLLTYIEEPKKPSDLSSAFLNYDDENDEVALRHGRAFAVCINGMTEELEKVSAEINWERKLFTAWWDLEGDANPVLEALAWMGYKKKIILQKQKAEAKEFNDEEYVSENLLEYALGNKVDTTFGIGQAIWEAYEQKGEEELDSSKKMTAKERVRALKNKVKLSYFERVIVDNIIVTSMYRKDKITKAGKKGVYVVKQPSSSPVLREIQQNLFIDSEKNAKKLLETLEASSFSTGKYLRMVEVSAEAYRYLYANSIQFSESIKNTLLSLDIDVSQNRQIMVYGRSSQLSLIAEEVAELQRLIDLKNKDNKTLIERMSKKIAGEMDDPWTFKQDKYFAPIVLIANLVNFKSAIDSLDSQTVNVANFIAAVLGTAGALINTFEVFKKDEENYLIAKYSGISINSLGTKVTVGLGFAASIVDAITQLIKAYNALEEANEDAATAYFVSAILFGVGGILLAPASVPVSILLFGASLLSGGIYALRRADKLNWDDVDRWLNACTFGVQNPDVKTYDDSRYIAYSKTDHSQEYIDYLMVVNPITVKLGEWERINMQDTDGIYRDKNVLVIEVQFSDIASSQPKVEPMFTKKILQINKRVSYNAKEKKLTLHFDNIDNSNMEMNLCLEWEEILSGNIYPIKSCYHIDSNEKVTKIAHK